MDGGHLDRIMEVFMMTTSSHLKHLWMYLVIVICWPTVVYFLMIYKKGYFQLDVALLVGGITLSLYSIPVLTMHLRHYLKSKNAKFEYNPSMNRMAYTSEELEVAFDTTDIEKITVFKSWPLAERRTLIFAWDTYNYALIKLKSGQTLNISSMLVYELDKVVKFDNTEIKKTFYAWIS